MHAANHPQRRYLNHKESYNIELRVKNLSKIKFINFLLAVLGNEDDYVDVSTLMLKVTNYH